jgi:hypothetical protein
MPNVMPSQVVLVIAKFFPHVTKATPGDGLIQSSHLDQLKGIVNLVREIPSELVTVPTDQYAELTLAMSIIEENNRLRVTRDMSFGVPALKGVDVATVLYRVLTECKDEFPPKATNELLFVTDPQLRQNIRQDVGAVTLAISHAEWKAANILAGAAMEALLHWKLGSGTPSDKGIQAAVDSAMERRTLKTRPASDLDNWSLHHFVEVCGETKVLKPKTVEAARLCNSYRNLIHPGRAQRLGEVCTRGTAYVAVGALSNVVDDLDIGTGAGPQKAM